MIIPPLTFNDGNPEKLGGIVQLAMFYLVVEPLPICKLDVLLEVEVKRIYIYIIYIYICNHHLALYWGWSSHP